MTMTIKRCILASACALAIPLLLPVPAARPQASTALRPKFRFQYAAKFLCGVNQGTLAEGAGVLPGSYTTAINIHNPQGRDVPLRKKVAISFPVRDGSFLSGGQLPGAVSFFLQDRLAPDQALQVDCEQIPEEFTFPPEPPVIGPNVTFTEGFLAIESLDSLDVTVVYTAESLEGGDRSIDTESVRERLIDTALTGG
jgi:hypothetical protein